MSFPLFVVKKYVNHKSEKKFISLISLITILGITLGVSILIITLSILDGFESTITDKITSFNSHIKITAFGNRVLEEDNESLQQIRTDLNKYLNRLDPFLSKLSIIRSDKQAEGITLLGIDFTNDENEISRFVFQGNLDSIRSTTFPRIALGSKLAEKLFISTGDTLVLFSLKNDVLPSQINPPVILQFRVEAIYKSGMKEYDDIYAYTDILRMRELLELSNVVSGYNIKLNDISVADSLSEVLQDNLRYPYYVRSFFSIHRNIFTWIELQKKPIPIILALIIIVAVFNIVGSLLINVLEKTKEIGILKSLGARKKQILMIFIYQGIFLGGIGIITGNVLAFILSYVQNTYDIISIPQSVYYLSSVPIEINLFNYGLISFLALTLCLGASLIPSFIAAKVKPISAIKFD